MPRIPLRTTPYSEPTRCTRHFKSKRDLSLKSLGKSSWINGMQFVITYISPKGEVEHYGSELLQECMFADPSTGRPGVLNKDEWDRQAIRVKAEMARRLKELKRLEALGESPIIEDDDADEGEENDDEEEDEEDQDPTAVPTPELDDMDPDRTLVEDEIDIKMLVNDDSPSAMKTSSPFPAVSGPTSAVPITSTGAAAKPKNKKKNKTTAAADSVTVTEDGHTLRTVSVKYDKLDDYYIGRFTAMQQIACRLLLKVWIKVIQPKKQVKCPYNGGEEAKPAWWPQSVRHKEPDHLSKAERLQVLAAIIRSPLAKVDRLQLATAEMSTSFDKPRSMILQECYSVATEEVRRRKGKASKSDIVVRLPFEPVHASAVTPDPGEKRAAPARGDKENEYPSTAQTNMPDMAPQTDDSQPNKRMKLATRPPAIHLPNSYDASQVYQPFPFGVQNQNYGVPSHDAWRNGPSPPPAQLSPFPQDQWSSVPPTEYARSPMPNLDMQAHVTSQPRYHPSHLAPILPNGQMGGSTTPIDSPYPQSGSDQANPSSAGYFPRQSSSSGLSYMQQQQMEYMQQHAQQQHHLHNQHQQHVYHHQYSNQQLLHTPRHLQLQHQHQQSPPPVHSQEFASQEVQSQDVQQQHLQVPQTQQSQQPPSTFDYGSPYLNDWADQAFPQPTA